jgi:hypothetical protein
VQRRTVTEHDDVGLAQSAVKIGLCGGDTIGHHERFDPYSSFTERLGRGHRDGGRITECRGGRKENDVALGQEQGVGAVGARQPRQRLQRTGNRQSHRASLALLVVE